jgi:biopolymer transport protein ExbD
MKFPRNARILKGQLDAAPFAGVFFCLLIFLLLASVVYTPGVRIELSESLTGLPAVPGPAVSVMLDTNGLLYYENQVVRSNDLKRLLAVAVAQSPAPLTLLVWQDKAGTREQLQGLVELGWSAGITHFAEAVKPRAFDVPPTPRNR